MRLGQCKSHVYMLTYANENDIIFTHVDKIR